MPLGHQLSGSEALHIQGCNGLFTPTLSLLALLFTRWTMKSSARDPLFIDWTGFTSYHFSWSSPYLLTCLCSWHLPDLPVSIPSSLPEHDIINQVPHRPHCIDSTPGRSEIFLFHSIITTTVRMFSIPNPIWEFLTRRLLFSNNLTSKKRTGFINRPVHNWEHHSKVSVQGVLPSEGQRENSCIPPTSSSEEGCGAWQGRWTYTWGGRQPINFELWPSKVLRLWKIRPTAPPPGAGEKAKREWRG